jgi:integrase
VLKVLKRIEGRGTHETAHRTRQRCSQVFRYAVQTERAAHDVTGDLRGALAPVVSDHHAAITEPARIGELLRAIDGYTGHFVTAYALKLAPLFFVRPGELRSISFRCPSKRSRCCANCNPSRGAARIYSRRFAVAQDR